MGRWTYQFFTSTTARTGWKQAPDLPRRSETSAYPTQRSASWCCAHLRTHRGCRSPAHRQSSLMERTFSPAAVAPLTSLAGSTALKVTLRASRRWRTSRRLYGDAFREDESVATISLASPPTHGLPHRARLESGITKRTVQVSPSRGRSVGPAERARFAWVRSGMSSRADTMPLFEGTSSQLRATREHCAGSGGLR